jgi:hypothetical protein
MEHEDARPAPPLPLYLYAIGSGGEILAIALQGDGSIQCYTCFGVSLDDYEKWWILTEECPTLLHTFVMAD